MPVADNENGKKELKRFVRAPCVFAHGTPVLSISGQQQVGQQKTEDRAYVSNVTGLERTRNNSFKSVAYRLAKARSCRISSTALMAASSSSSLV